MRKRKLLAFGLAFCLGLSGVWNFSKPVFAAEAQSESQVQSENTSGEDHITARKTMRLQSLSSRRLQSRAIPMGHMVQMQCILALPMENTNLCFPVWLAG